MSTTRFLVLRGCTFAADITVNFRGSAVFRNGGRRLSTFQAGSGQDR